MIIKYGDRRIGFLNFQKRENEFFLIDIQISRQYQNKGLGSYLLSIVEKRTKRSGIRKLTLGVYWDNPSLNLYKRLGFKIVKRKKHFAVMRKNI